MLAYGGKNKNKNQDSDSTFSDSQILLKTYVFVSCLMLLWAASDEVNKSCLLMKFLCRMNTEHFNPGDGP